jgi:serine/threonine protein kinase
MPTSSPEESIFYAAIQLEPPAREAYLAGACGPDGQLRGRVAALLSAYGEGEFLEDPAADLAATALLPSIGERPGDQIGPYKLLEQIGEGGMGLVFMAEQTKPLRRRVALKIIKPGLDTRAVIARFEAERQALALMDHPNIAKIFDAGTTGEMRNAEFGMRSAESGPFPSEIPHSAFPLPHSTGRPYFVMELVRGAPITDYCTGRGLSLRERLELFIAVCDAVQHAHQKGVIHRDLKPTNILVSQTDTAPVPKVIDFGVAKATASQTLTDKTLFTAFSQIIGTPLYMSPEQADVGNQDVDTRSDVYSLGVVLYELLTGTTPFDSERLRSVGHDEMRRIIREEEPPKPSTRATTAAVAAAAASTVAAKPQPREAVDNSALRGDLDWIVMKALEKDRRRRYESPSALGDDIRRHLSNEVVEARRPSHRYVMQRFARRHRATLTGLAAIALILVTASVVGVLLAVRATQAEGLAKSRLQEVTRERNEKETAHRRAVAGEEAAQRARELAETARDAAETARKAAVWSVYSSRMVQASSAWIDRDYAALRQLTGSTKEVEGGPDFRGWEWYFLDRQLQNAFGALPPGPVWSAAWHPQRTELAVVTPAAARPSNSGRRTAQSRSKRSRSFPTTRMPRSSCISWTVWYGLETARGWRMRALSPLRRRTLGPAGSSSSTSIRVGKYFANELPTAMTGRSSTLRDLPSVATAAQLPPATFMGK